MESKTSILVALAIAIIAIAAVGAFFLMNNTGPESDPEGSIPAIKQIPNESDMARLNILGNANKDDLIDSKDVDYIKNVINKKEGNNFYCDANQDGYVDSKDLEMVRNMISKSIDKVYYVSVADDVRKCSVPIKNIATGFRRTNEMIATLGCTDMIVATTNGGVQQYGWIGFSQEAQKNIINPGQGNDGSVSSEVLLEIYKQYRNKGGLTIMGGVNGMDSNMESYVEGMDVDVVRLGCTETSRYDDGMVTMAYLLSFNKEHASKIAENIAWWLNMNDSAVKLIDEAVSKLTDKEKSVVVLATSGNNAAINIRGTTTAEQVLCVKGGIDYLDKYGASAYATLSNEHILSMQRDGMTKIVAESNNYYKTVMGEYDKATTDAERKAALNYMVEFGNEVTTRDTMAGYTGEYYFLPQEMCCGAEIPMFRMLMASIFLPSLSSTFTYENVTQTFQDFIKRINPDAPFVNATLLYHC